MADPNLPIGTELRTPFGTRWVKVGTNYWRVRGDWGVIDELTSYRDRDVYGDVVGA